MCGIAGYFGQKEISDSRVKSCLKQMQRRGPNAEGMYHHSIGGQNIYLLHTRLSILDLESRSDQPFESESNAIVYNGELYNYLELKNKLLHQKINFKTSSDTEVFLHAHLHYGTNHC